MNEIKVFSIGKIRNNNSEIKVILDTKYTAGLKGLKDYSHVQLLWWLDCCDNEKDRTTLVEKKSYKKGTDEIGVLSSRRNGRQMKSETETIQRYLQNSDTE